MKLRVISYINSMPIGGCINTATIKDIKREIKKYNRKYEMDQK